MNRRCDSARSSRRAIVSSLKLLEPCNPTLARMAEPCLFQFPRLRQILLNRLANTEIRCLVNPANRTGLVNQHQSRCVDATPPTVVVLGRASAVELHHPVFRVGEDGERSLQLFLDPLASFGRINANGQHLHVQGLEVILVPYELTELAQAVRSPVATVEINEDVVASIARQAHALAVGRGEHEIRGLVSNLDFQRQDLILCRCGCSAPSVASANRTAVSRMMNE